VPGAAGPGGSGQGGEEGGEGRATHRPAELLVLTEHSPEGYLSQHEGIPQSGPLPSTVRTYQQSYSGNDNLSSVLTQKWHILMETAFRSVTSSGSPSGESC